MEALKMHKGSFENAQKVLKLGGVTVNCGNSYSPFLFALGNE